MANSNGTATCLQTVDTNSAYFAKFCFSLGIHLKRVEVIADDEDEIIEAVRRMSDRYDFVVTSGGIGPTSVSKLNESPPPPPLSIYPRKKNPSVYPHTGHSMLGG